ncbi:hypothetical protein L7F22_041109 [Adiantum nelumboides]|nr:hypothetical protein [Adiantum nelumboides]
MAGGGDSSALLSIPTWAIAVTCAIFILVSLVIERVIHCIGNCAGRYNHAAFLHAFEKMKDELLMVGILSLALATGQDAFTKACVRASWYKHARLCDDYGKDATKAIHVSIHSQQRRQLAAAADATSTCKAGHVEFISATGIHDLHIFIFTLAAVHIVFTVIIIAIGMWIVGRWKAWEARVADKEKLIIGGWEKNLLVSLVPLINALTAAYAIWVAVTFPTHTCVNGSKTSFIERTAIGVFVQVLCGVVALPVYALVSQMGSRLKKSVFNENVNSAVSRWHVRAKKMSSKGENDSSHGKQPSIESVLGEGHSVHVQQVEMGAGEQPASARIASFEGIIDNHQVQSRIICE